MQVEESRTKAKGCGSIKDYIDVIKPRETGLLVFIGVITALVAASGTLPFDKILFIMAAVLAASAGANGLTNYLDRHLDARMQRTCNRVLPARRIFPPERALVYTAFLSAAGLLAAWYLHPLAFLADIVGTAAALIYRKRVTCVFPQGMIASCAPVLMGWFAVRTDINATVLLLCVLIALWLPSHIWSIMAAHKEDYRQAGITYFPVNCSLRVVSRILFVFAILLLGASLGLYFAAGFGLLYLVIAVLSGIMIVYASWRLMATGARGDAWKLYKLSAFPYLGLVFLVMALDIWLSKVLM
jgi:protoheme IX farnesyltransferase